MEEEKTTVCELEGIPRNEYLQELSDLLSEFLPGVSEKQIGEERRTGCTF